MKIKLPKITYNSPVIITFALISLVSLILGIITSGGSTALLFSVYRGSLADPLFYIRLFTHVLGHADVSHYMGNFMIILLVGPILEEKYGGKALLIMMAVTALITGLVNVIFFPGVALLGASGVAFMMILLSSYANCREGEIPLTLILAAVLYLGTEIVDGLFANDNISQTAHIIGGICGGVFGGALAGKRSKQS